MVDDVYSTTSLTATRPSSMQSRPKVDGWCYTGIPVEANVNQATGLKTPSLDDMQCHTPSFLFFSAVRSSYMKSQTGSLLEGTNSDAWK